MRSIVYHFDDPRAFRSFILGGERELALPLSETVADGEWVLAIFEVGRRKRATAAAAKGLDRGEQNWVLVFEDRDWSRIVAFAEAAEISLSGEHAAAPVPMPRATPPSKPVKRDAPSEPSDTQVSRIDEAFAPPRAPTHGIVTRSTTSRVLLVEDDPAMRDLVKSMLEADGLEVDTVESGEAAQEKTATEAFDLMVLDWNLPGMSGIELCRKLRRDERLSLMPILFLTGHASSRDVVEAFSSGADDFVSKPFRAPELNARILGLLRRARVSEPNVLDDEGDDE